MAVTYPPPKQDVHIASVLGWVFVVVGPLAVVGVVAGVLLGSGKSSVFVAVTCLIGVVVSATGVALLRLQAWALLAAAFEMFAGTAALIVLMVSMIRNPPGPPGTDGAGY